MAAMTEEERTQVKVQRSRRKALRRLMDYHGVWPNMDYGFEELTAIVGEQDPQDNDVDFKPEDCPQFGCVWSDETYTVIVLHDSKGDAIRSMVPDGSDTLNIPGEIYDLDAIKFGKGGQPMRNSTIKYKLVALSEESAAALAGLVAPTYEGGDHLDVLDGGQCVNQQGIFCDWDELRSAFPIQAFREWAQDEDNYLPTFGE